MTRSLVLLPGDGIGPEVVAAADVVLQAVCRRFDHRIDTRRYPMGGAALRAGLTVYPDETRAACLEGVPVLLGAVGDPAFDHLPRDQKIETGLLALRSSMGVYANLRPARAWEGLEDATPFKPQRTAGTDLIIVRELLGGLYFGEPRGIAADGRSAFNTMRYSEDEVVRVARVAFALARGRSRRLLSVDKANVLETSQLWRRVVTALAADYPEVSLEHQYVDAFAMNLALNPTRYDVVLTENLFGDILSDEAAVLAGSLGMLPSASLGERRTEHGTFGLYEPIHGSAPDIAGQDRANPIGTILSAAMLLRLSLGCEDAAAAVEAAVSEALDHGWRTSDLADPARTDDGLVVVGTTAFGTAVVDRLVAAVSA
ncbi:MAG: 3-isopropylmalate dehydrogenase [Actinomycetota bacterium]|nr:3-isopropylmalate dehydrogenase [Actinomycetota bacterium]